MNISGAAVIWLVYEGFVLWLAIKSSLEAWYVFQNRVTDRKGRPLWFYANLDGLPVGAKNRKQALVLTVGMAIGCFALALPPLVTIITARLAH
jgi:hypothetical protein